MQLPFLAVAEPIPVGSFSPVEFIAQVVVKGAVGNPDQANHGG